MESYLAIVRKILAEGTDTPNRTGVNTRAITGALFEHEMSEGFPLLTTKKVPSRLIRVELEGFIKGVTDKTWFQERGCHIWDEWCNPQKVPYGHDEETRKRMTAERDLGPIYGFQWRHFGAEYKGPDHDHTGEGVDQLEEVVRKLQMDPTDRRMVVSAWNPRDLSQMALPPCHYAFQVLVRGGKLDLMWGQRSIDTMLGLPFNIASYAFLLQLLAESAEFEPGKLVGSLADVHIYHNQFDGAEEQLSRKPLTLSTVRTENLTSIFNWEYTDTKVVGYQSHPKIEFPIAI